MKKYKNILLTIILLLFIVNINLVINATKEASLLFFNKVFISIFPFIILCDILIYYDYHLFLNKIFGKIISKLFNVNENVSIIFILSMLTSFPANAVYLKDMLDNNQIDKKDATNILTFTYFPSIPFVIGTIGVKLYNSLTIGFILWLTILLNNTLIGIYLRNKNNSKTILLPIQKEKNIFILLKKSIIKAINTSLIILGNLIIFMIIVSLIKNHINTNDIVLSIISGVLELTNGIVMISTTNIGIILKLTITLFLLLFSSISTLFQSFSILSDYKINIKKILIIKLVFSIITSVILNILINVLIS